MEPLESAAGQKCAKEVMEKNLIQKRWVSTSTKRSTFANLQGEKHLQRKCAQSSDSGMTGTPPSPAVSHSSHESEFPQPYSGSLSDQLPHSNPQPPTRETFPVGTKPQLQPGMDTQGWAFSGQPQSHALEDFFPRRSRGRGGVISRRKSPGFPFSKYPQSGREQLEDTHKKEQRPKKPGKYICHYCGRACAKPSVLKKHIRSHTGERPYPCVPCGFSFKTKSNLYKHRKSHAHAIKAGLVPFSELASMRTDTDQASPLGEGEVHSDGEQSTDTDEDTSETAVLFSKSSPLSSKASRSTPEKDISEAAELGEERVGGSAKVPLLIVPKQGTLLATLQCPKLVETETSPVGPREGALEECHTVKQRLALRLHEKKGQDSESSYNLLSPHSKGSTDSGYFSRSESAEQQVSPPITNAKSYEEIMFGKYYRPSPRPRQPITVGTVTAAHKDINVADLTINPSVMQKLGMSDISEDLVSHIYTKDENMVESVNLHRNIFVRGNIMGSQRAEGFDQKYSPNLCQSNTILLETPTDTGSLIRSNSMPTSSVVNLDVPPGLRGSHSFDERMTTDDVFYPGAGGLRRLTRQAAFELSAHEGHAESDNHGAISKTTVLTSGGANVGELSPHELKGYGSYGTKAGIESYHEIQLQLMHQRQAMETATRKRRKEKSVGDEDDSPSHCSSDHSGSIDILGSPEDYDSKLMNQDALRATPTGKGQLHSVYSQLDSIDIGARMSLEDRIFVQDSDRKAAGNVISVIQHTNSLSRPSSFEKSDSVDHLCYQQVKPSSSYSEHSDSETTEEVQSMGSISRSESMEQQQSESDTAAPQRQMPHRLVRQPNIQVPEIRVTEEPDKPEKVAEVHVKEPEKHVEEFQWPQRSETLSQLPAEKLPPKKKRLRLAEIEHSSGESSFESTCTSLSRSPSQESNLSHTSSISMSFDREESIKLATPMKQEDIGKQSEFLTVPGSGHSLSVLNQHQQREMRRSSSEQVPCTLPTEIPEMRSKSFDYGSLSSSSRQGEMYASASSMKERRRGYLVRQASLSVHPESMVQEKGLDMNIKQEHLEQMHSGLYRSHVARQSAPSPLVCTDYDTPVADVSRLKRNTQPVPHLHTQASQLNISEGNQAEGQMLIKKSSHSPGQQLLGCDRSTSEMPSREVAWHPSHHSSMAQTSFLSLQPGVFWNPEAMQRHKQDAFIQMQQLQKPHIRQSSVPQSYQKPLQSPQLPQIQAQGDSKAADTASDQTHHYSQRASTNQLSDLLSKTFPTSPLLLPLSQPSLPGMLVPVRVQTNVLSYGSMMYTTVSQMLVTHAQGGTSNSMVVCKVTDDPNTALTKYRLSPSQILTQPGGPLHYPWKVPEPLPVQLNTGIPLALTCGTISTTDASSMGGSKRLLSPASSLELFKEIKQQKRVKEERMYGQIVEELSAVELGNSGAGSDCGELQKPCPEKELCQRMPLPMIMDSPEGTESPDELEVDEPSREEGAGKGDVQEGRQATDSKRLETMQVDCPVSEGTVTAGGTIGTVLLNDIADVQQASRFPSLRTTTSVSWCFLNYTKPNDALTASLASVYASWCVSSYNPNPPSLSTKSALGLLCSKQKKNTETYAMASMCPPGMGKVVSSYLWKQKPEQEKPELMQLDMIKSEKKPRGISCRDRVKEDHKEKEVSSKQAEPTRIKIFEGGYKSNEDYVYVRGRGRGKYICEECGIRCKKPSMLKKHIRSHTDVRPYVCKFCNFAFKTKGNLTKHMKSKAHTKKCLELGVPVTSVDDVEAEETDYDQRDSGKTGVSGMVSEHQFSDADDSEGAEEDGDEIEEEDDDDDEYEGDSTPKTCSRSASPRPDGISSLSSNRDPASELSGPTPKHPLFSYFLNPPSIQITQLAGESLGSEDQSPARTAPSGEGYRKNLDVPSSMEEDSFGGLSPEHGSASPVCGSSPARETSPTSRRYLSPRRDLSPRGRLSPRREASPLRHISPKRRDLSPRGHLAAISSTRPLSPGRDIPGRRELSPRSRHRGMMRAASPRRGLHHHLHSAPWDLGQYLLPEAGFTGQEKRKNSAQSLWLPGEMTGSPDPPTVAQQGLFSHLPLHSQRQVRTPLPMIPIGGIQVVHSTAGPTYPARLPLQRNPLEGPAPDQASLQLLEGMANAAGEKGAPGSQEKLPSSPGALTVTSSACGSAGGDMADPGNEDSRQEESIQTCTKAIASLRIASEDAHEKVPESADPHCHPPPPPPQPHHRHHTDPSEGAQVRIQHFSGSEQGQCQADILATSPDSLGSERDKVNTPETPPGHAPLLCKSANERLSGQQGLRENENKHKDG